MTTKATLPVEERLVRLLQHLGIEQVHVAASAPHDYVGFATVHPEMIASLTLLAGSMDESMLRPLASRLLVFGGDRGPGAQAVARFLPSLSGVSEVTLRDYFQALWSDVAADRTEEVGTALLEFLARMDQKAGVRAMTPPPGEGEVDGISYRAAGAGPPLVLLPLGLAASQWEPLLPALSRQYCTITLGGAALGAVAQLEERARAEGFLSMVRRLMDEAQLQPGEAVLDVGCGSGVLDRWLARRTAGANPIAAVDVNRYLLREAAALARREGLEEVITFREGNAAALPFAEGSFDVAMSVTVMEEVDADRMMAEMVRVTKPGGRVAVVVRALDMPRWVNLPLRAELKAKADASTISAGGGGGVAERGCADAGLYRRMRAAGLSQVQMMPQLAAFQRAGHEQRIQNYQTEILARFSSAEVEEWRAAVAQAEAEGTFFIAQPFHCAVGTKR